MYYGIPTKLKYLVPRLYLSWMMISSERNWTAWNSIIPPHFPFWIQNSAISLQDELSVWFCQKKQKIHIWHFLYTGSPICMEMVDCVLNFKIWINLFSNSNSKLIQYIYKKKYFMYRICHQLSTLCKHVCLLIIKFLSTL